MSTPDPDNDGALFVYGSLLDAAHRAALLGREVAAAMTRALNRDQLAVLRDLSRALTRS